jgi:fluoride ion exporter CrcB/FEX
LANHDDDDDIEQRRGDGNDEESDEDDEEKKRKAAENELPSLRAVITAIFIMALVTQCTSIFLYNSPIDREIALSLLFSPLGVLARWRLTKLNRWKPTFPLGTFTCNILACALSGTLGDTNQVVLVSIVNGFGGTLSSLASFVVEILAGIDPILFRFDGVIYAAASIGCAMVVGFIFSASVEWADSVVSRTAAVTPNDIDVVVSNVTENLTRYW